MIRLNGRGPLTDIQKAFNKGSLDSEWPCEYLTNAVCISRDTLGALVEDYQSKKEALTKTVLERELYKEDAKDANLKLKTATEELDRLATLFREARTAISMERAVNKAAVAEVEKLRNLSLSFDSMKKEADGYKSVIEQKKKELADKEKELLQVRQLLHKAQVENHLLKNKIDSVQGEVIKLKSDISILTGSYGSVGLSMSKLSSALSEISMRDSKESLFNSGGLLNKEVDGLRSQLATTKQEVEDRKRDIEMLHKLLIQIRKGK